MDQEKTITEVLAALILEGNVPLEAVLLACETIKIDACLRDYELGATRRTSLEKWMAFLEAYEVLLKLTHSATTDFSRMRDGYVLIQALSEIKEKLAEL